MKMKMGDMFVPQTNDPAMKTMPTCPHCNKNDKVFASHMFGKKDLSCIRCKRTFRPAPRNKKVVRARDIVWSQTEFKSHTRRHINTLLSTGHNITVR